MAGHANYLATFGTKGVRTLPKWTLPPNKGSQGIYNAFSTLYILENKSGLSSKQRMGEGHT
jgi:hypothetical protein